MHWPINWTIEPFAIRAISITADQAEVQAALNPEEGIVPNSSVPDLELIGGEAKEIEGAGWVVCDWTKTTGWADERI